MYHGNVCSIAHIENIDIVARESANRVITGCVSIGRIKVQNIVKGLKFPFIMNLVPIDISLGGGI